jgi:tripartite-type tricarboxylate transporter receptor subunit TctC
MRWPRRLFVVWACALGGATAAVQAQDWSPSKTVRIVVPIAGTTNDTLARLVAPKLAEALGQAVIVENRPGAGGNIGSAFVSKAEPDGHTLLVGYNGPIAINPTLMKNALDPVKDLTPVTLAMKGAQYLVVNPAAGVSNVQELVQSAKKNPNKHKALNTNKTMRMCGVAKGMSKMRLKSVKPLLPPKPVSLRKNKSMKAKVMACVMMEK